jgi:hypothetical protein
MGGAHRLCTSAGGKRVVVQIPGAGGRGRSRQQAALTLGGLGPEGFDLALTGKVTAVDQGWLAPLLSTCRQGAP